jgi:DNA-binding transcriptional regulator YiaG
MTTINKKTPAVEAEVLAQSKEIIPQENTIVNFNVESLMAKAIEHGLSPETMEKFLAMRMQLKQEWAKEQYNKAMALFQSECPTIVKTKGVKTKSGIVAYKYAPIESIVEQVKPYLQKNGFSYSTGMEVLPDGVRVVCKVTHIDGHSEESAMQVPLGTKTEIMSQSQVTAAASTFAKRYAFCNAFGILTGDEDTDARPQEKEEVFDDSQVLKLILSDLEACDTALEYELRSSDIKIARQNGKLSDESFAIVKEACAATVKRIQTKGLKPAEPETDAAKLMKQGMAKAKALTQ